MSKDKPYQPPLKGWNQIAAFVNIPMNTLRTKYRDSIPLLQEGGKGKTPVVADRDAVEKWARGLYGEHKKEPGDG